MGRPPEKSIPPEHRPRARALHSPAGRLLGIPAAGAAVDEGRGCNPLGASSKPIAMYQVGIVMLNRTIEHNHSCDEGKGRPGCI